MAARSYNNNQLTIDQERHETNKIASTSSCKRRRGTEKRVISVPIKDLQGFRLKGDHMSAPPSDSWAWRKYGQKPIKGSPYPRGYYRCSSSKGCPARKQVERSRSDPDLLIVSYSCEHNHSSPAFNSRNHHNRNFIATTSVSEEDDEEEEEYEEEVEEVEEGEEKKPVINKEEFDTNNNPESQEQVPEHKFISLCADQADGDRFRLFDFEPALCCTVLDQCPILIEEKCDYSTENEMAMIFTMREEDESLFADLGGLPECSDCFPA